MTFLFEDTQGQWTFTADGDSRPVQASLADSFAAILKESGRLDLTAYAPNVARHFENTPAKTFTTTLAEIIQLADAAKSLGSPDGQPRRNSLMGNWKRL